MKESKKGNIIKKISKRISGNRSTCFFLAIILMIILATFKYVSKGDAYIYEIGWADEKTELNGNVVTQDITIDHKAIWSDYSYSVFLYIETKIEDGCLEAALYQDGKQIDVIVAKPVYLKTGWYTFDKFDYSKLKPGTATIRLTALNTNAPVYIGTRDNIYNIPSCSINGTETNSVISQRYHINYNNREYKLRLMAYVLFVVLCLLAAYITINRPDDKKSSNIIRLILTAAYLCLTFIYDSSLMMSPTWAEEVTNFMTAGYENTLGDNILLSDAGYLPLFQRLIALFSIKLLRLKAYESLFAMQGIAYLVTGIVLSFFSGIQFKQYVELKYRYLLSLIFMMLVVNKESGAFINFIGYGIIIIFFYFLADSKGWSRAEFVIICFFSFLATMSKGIYVTILPFMVLCMLMFFKNYSKRDVIYSLTCATGALLQLIYYFTNGADWIDRNECSEMDNYHLKLVIQSLIDVPNRLLGVFTGNIGIFNGISGFIVVAFWAGIFILFIRKILRKWLAGDKVSKMVQLIFMAVIYISAQSLFLRITVYGIKSVNIIHDDFWTFDDYGIDGRYMVQIFAVVAFLFVVLIKWGTEKAIRNFKEILIGILLICVTISQPRFQIKGFGNDNYAAARTNLSDLNAEVNLFKKYETNDTLVIPIQPNQGWRSVKDADIYCFGSDINAWSARCIESDEPWRGRLSLVDYNVDHTCAIYQIFIKKQNLIKRSDYQIVLYDTLGNEVHRQVQDNENYQRIASFTFDDPISDIGYIHICDSEGKNVFIENSMYVITKSGSPFIVE